MDTYKLSTQWIMIWCKNGEGTNAFTSKDGIKRQSRLLLFPWSLSCSRITFRESIFSMTRRWLEIVTCNIKPHKLLWTICSLKCHKSRYLPIPSLQLSCENNSCAKNGNQTIKNRCILIRTYFPVHIRVTHKWNTRLRMSLGLHSTSSGVDQGFCQEEAQVLRPKVADVAK